LNDPKRRRCWAGILIFFILALLAGSAWTTQRPDLMTGQMQTTRLMAPRTPFEILAALMILWSDLLTLLGFTLFFALIGYGLLYLLHPDGSLAGLSYLGIAIACGLSFFPILIFLMSIVHLKLTAGLLFIILGGLIFLVIGVAALRNRGRWKLFVGKVIDWVRSEGWHGWFSADRIKPRFSLFLFGFTLLLALAVRVLQTEDIYAPLWMDGLTHTQNIARILTEGGMPDGMLYHLGFHMNAAVLFLLTDLSLPHLTLLMGQWLTVMSGLTFYLIAKKITGRVLPAWVSVIGLWFFSCLPGYLINWGRYPFLLGLVLLPGVVFTISMVFQKGCRGDYILAMILLCGLFLSHYGTLSLCVTLLFSFGLHFVWNHRKSLRSDFSSGMIGFKDRIWITAGVVLTLVLILTFRLAPLFQNGQMAAIIQQSLATAENIAYADLLQMNFGSAGGWVWGAGLLGIVVADFLDRRSLAIIGGWVLAQPALIWLQRPFFGEAIASYTNWFLILSFPISILAGIFVEWLLYQVVSSQPGWGAKFPDPLFFGWGPGIAWAGLVLVLVGFPIQIGNINPGTILFGAADRPAVEWIRENTPDNARFLINSNYWGTLSIAPSDGGSWLTLMTGRSSLYMEDPATDWFAFMRAHPVDYVYLGRGGGFLQPEWFSDPANGFVLVYDQGDIKIYKVPKLPRAYKIKEGFCCFVVLLSRW
jgi:hypothetical protein